MKTSPTFLLMTTSACMASIALFAQNSTGKDNSVKTDPVVLPTVVVQGDPSTLFTSNKITAEKRTPASAPTRYFLSETDRALNRFTLPLFGRTPEQRALARFREDQRLEQLATLEDRIAFLKQTDPNAAKRLQKEMYSLALRDDYLPVTTSLASTR